MDLGDLEQPRLANLGAADAAVPVRRSGEVSGRPGVTPGALTRGQKIGLAIVGMFYGEIAAAIVLVVAITARNATDLAFVRDHLSAFGRVLLSSCALEGLTGAVTWLVFAVPLLVYLSPEWFRAGRGRVFVVAVGMGVLTCGVLALALWFQLHRVHGHAHLGAAAVAVTFFFGFVLTAVGLWRFLGLVKDVERQIAVRNQLTHPVIDPQR